MSERTFLRRFKAATGLAPGAWLLAARLARARDLLEETRLSVEAVAAACGFGTAATLRHHFGRQLGLSPTEHRARFGRLRPERHTGHKKAASRPVNHAGTTPPVAARIE
jgi:AraC family transcriptional activator FtrA